MCQYDQHEYEIPKEPCTGTRQQSEMWPLVGDPLDSTRNVPPADRTEKVVTKSRWRVLAAVAEIIISAKTYTY